MVYDADMINLCSVGYKEIAGKHSCDCGTVHEFDVSCLLERGAFKQLPAFLSTLTPLLSKVVVFYDDDALCNEVCGAIKRDYRVVAISADGDKGKVDNEQLPEDTKLVLAVGSAAAISSAKYKAHLCDLPVVVAALPDFTALSPLCVLNDGGQMLSYVVNKPKAYIFDTEYPLSCGDKAQLYGQIAARLTSAFDYYVSALLGETGFCPFVMGGLSDIAAKTILALDGASKQSLWLSETLLTAALKQALVASAAPVTRSGEIQCAMSYARLNGNEFLQGELQFVFGAVLSSLYKKHLIRRRTFVSPPDNNYRLEQIASFFGTSEYRAVRMLEPQISGKQAGLIEYKLREYAPDLKEKLRRNVGLYKLAFRTFKRLHLDDGYALSGLGADLSLCIALSPDIVKGNGMLTALKRLGDLDGYIG